MMDPEVADDESSTGPENVDSLPSPSHKASKRKQPHPKRQEMRNKRARHEEGIVEEPNETSPANVKTETKAEPKDCVKIEKVEPKADPFKLRRENLEKRDVPPDGMNEVEFLTQRLNMQERDLEELQRLIKYYKKADEETQQVTIRTLMSMKETLCQQSIQLARKEREEARAQQTRDALRLGIYTPAMDGIMPGKWEYGTESEALHDLKRQIKRERLQTDALRKALKVPKKDENEEDEMTALEVREFCQTKLVFLNREETDLRERELQLRADRQLHLKKCKLLAAQDASEFRDFPFLANRYQILNMLGRGGFSEVYRAFDTETTKFVAVKIHQLRSEMSPESKESYIRHALRECEIHKQLVHPRVVQLLERFAINATSFGTVLELCSGEDLDTYLKSNGPLPEREARGIIIQVISGLKYMNSNGNKVIHYDLKPGNLMFYRGEVKLTDFGLSKRVENVSGNDTCDLTSMGAGTYWYLPPECFSNEGTPRISNKVDVWSVGIIFFEMLYGRRPFGHEQRPDDLLRRGTITSAFTVEFPPTPKVSMEGKDFLRRCLTYNMERRPDVFDCFNDPYIRRQARNTVAKTEVP